ncbi:alpha-keto acid decarboxylase family protein [Geodermatophilus maliterrae]|uniref:Alpha-keto-acid decarboxylase n=1 Tax=Geodermatophilus maliterrae TaxID=3162531 RepID=A0ABV3XCU0_9ACTN
MSAIENATSAPYTVGDHLVDRLAELGIDRVFGVPGDYSLALLDHVVAHPGVEWTGCTNELNAGYAADGYGRMRGIAALFTTYGVGELSALNAIAGSFAEHVPVVHVVGAPSRASQAARRLVHHTLGDGDFTHFAGMHAGVTCARAALTADNAAPEIDRVLTAVRDQGLPGYLLVPADVADAPVGRPSRPLPVTDDTSDPAVVAAFVDAAARLLGRVRSVLDVTVLAGLLVHRLGATRQLMTLVDAGPLPHATTLWAKSLVDESSPRFAGTYAGAGSAEQTRSAVEDAGALILAGVQFTDLNSGMFTQHIDRDRTIDLGGRSAHVGAATFSPLELPTALAALTALISELAGRETGAARSMPTPQPTLSEAPSAPSVPDEGTALSHSQLWAAVTAFLRPGDIVLADQGTAFYGVATHRLPADVTFIGQPLWASIGYTLPAMFGACTARPGRRGVLLIGDGAAQMTIQELASVIRAELPAVVIVVDNNGYAVERAIHGPTQPYNDISRWDWTVAPQLFGGSAAATPPHAVRVTTHSELQSALAAAEDQPRRLTLVQAVLPPTEVPELLTTLAQALAHANSARATELPR